MRYKDLPQSDEYKLPEEHLEKIMLMALPIGKYNILTGSDAIIESADRKFTFGDNFHIAISADTKEEADNLFNELSVGGNIEMSISESPWGIYFGMLADKFGIQWTVDFDPKNEGQTEK